MAGSDTTVVSGEGGGTAMVAIVVLVAVVIIGLFVMYQGRLATPSAAPNAPSGNTDIRINPPAQPANPVNPPAPVYPPGGGGAKP
jgi:hypothetical protein